MKKILIVLLGLLLSLPASARDFTYTYRQHTLTYTVVSEIDKTCMTKAGSSYTPGHSVEGGLIIPSKVSDGNDIYTVTSLGDYSFSNCDKLTSVSIPETVTTIGKGAFDNCNGLEKAEFKSIEALCRTNFMVYNSNPLEYAHHLYINGEEVTEVVIPESITTIGDITFQGCSALTSVTIPESVSSIGQYAFYECSALTSITLPDALSSIGEWAFGYCSGLTSISIPESVTSIDDYAFRDCRGLKKAEFKSIEALCRIKFGANSANPLYYAGHLYINGQEITEVVIPKSITTIGDETFNGCSALTSVTIHDSVTSIGKGAFVDCSGLTSISIPESVKSIGPSAFRYCDGLTSITIPQSVTSIGSAAFANTGLKSVYYGAKKPIAGSDYVFDSAIYENATLYMSEDGAIRAGAIDPWKNFKHIEVYDFTGIDDITVDIDNSRPYEVYNPAGVKVADSTDGLAPGLYIVRQGKTVKKIAVN